MPESYQFFESLPENLCSQTLARRWRPTIRPPASVYAKKSHYPNLGLLMRNMSAGPGIPVLKIDVGGL